MSQALDRKLGRAVWEVLHSIAVTFPDGELTKQRLRGYYDFFKSLEYVLPRAAWRDTWRMVTGTGETELTWEAFQKVRDHKTLSRWLFGVHDAVRAHLGQPRSTVSYAKLYEKYRAYRPNSGKTNTNDGEDREGVQRLRTILKTRVKAIDEYLVKVFGDAVAQWPRVRKEAARKTYLDDAAAWHWQRLDDALSRRNTGYNKMNASKKREALLTEFDFEYRRAHQRVLNTVRGVPGSIRNYITQ